MSCPPVKPCEKCGHPLERHRPTHVTAKLPTAEQEWVCLECVFGPQTAKP